MPFHPFKAPVPLRCTPAKREGAVVVLGASFDQCPMIRTVRGKGLRAIALDMNPVSPGFALADEHAIVSTRDVDAVVAFCREAAKRVPIVGVTTMGSDIPHILAEIGMALDVPAVSRDTARLATDKFRMKERFVERGVPVPDFDRVESPAELAKIARERDFSFVMKPVDSAGSRGVFHPRREDDLDALFRQSQAASSSGRVMVEEFLPGPQVSTETLLVGNETHTTGMALRNYDVAERFRPQIMENGAEQRSGLSPELERACADLTVRAARALGIDRGVAKGDLVIHPERGPMLIEIAARLSGGHFCDALVPVESGINIIDSVIDLATGADPAPDALRRTHSKVASLRYLFPQPGVVRALRGVDAALEAPWLRLLETYLEPGECVRDPGHHGARAGAFLVEGDTRDEALERVAEVYDRIRFTTGH